ncbi:malonyl-CoA decarboxylase domain-containing protein [Agromyces bauzanensis]
MRDPLPVPDGPARRGGDAVATAADRAAEFLRLADSVVAANDPSQAATEILRVFASCDDVERRLVLRAVAGTGSRRRELLRRLDAVPGGTRALVDMREDVLALRREEPGLDEVERDLTQLLASSFSPGRLELRAIEWSSPVAVLEHVLRHDAVHRVTGWADLRRRLEPEDRRCFGLFHPALPDGPVVFTEIALTLEPPTSIGEILDPDRAPVPVELATTAVFYSISSGRPGLRGIRFGEVLIERAVTALHRELPRLGSYVTLSPIPGFRQWLAHAVGGPAAAAWEDLRRLHRRLERGDARSADDEALRRVAETYLRSTRSEDGRPADPVARFHLGNGARLERIQLRADLSTRGLEQAYGVMACYGYERQPV